MKQKEWQKLIRVSKERGDYTTLRMALDYFVNTSKHSLSCFIKDFSYHSVTVWYQTFKTDNKHLIERVRRFEDQFLFGYNIH